MAVVCKCNIECESYQYFWEENYKINKISNFHKQIIECKTMNQYLNIIINFIKDEVIRKFPDINKLKIQISSINNDNIYHQIIMRVSKFICEKLKIKEFNYNKSVFIIIWYEKKLIFMTNINFVI
jgi:hypothetical protein